MSTTYGNPAYGGGAYGGATDPFSLLGVVGATVEVYDNTGAFKGLYQLGSGEFLGLDFSISVSGSQEFNLYFADFVEIAKKDIIKILVFNQEDYFFTGVVRRIPIEGSTKAEYNYSGFGLNDYFVRMNTENQTYAADNVYDIVDDLLDNIITAKSPINKNIGKLDTALQSISVTAIDFNYISVQEALQQLKELAQSDGNEYVVGVDAEGDFFFKQRSTDILAYLVVGKTGRYGIEQYEPQDTIEQTTKFFILDKDGSFIGTVTSAIGNDIFEKKITAPDINSADVTNWAQGKLTEEEITTRIASIRWQIAKELPEIVGGDGRLRIISNVPPPFGSGSDYTAWGAGVWGSGLWGGGKYDGKDIDDTLRIISTRYIINSNVAVREIQLGGEPTALENIVVSVNKNVNDLRVSLGR
jgi:2-hydroxy-3-keto-5-methylthiopentenyl-1-phosphate phosphatase